MTKNCLSDKFNGVVKKIGMAELTHPVFYNSPIGIRFEIGVDEDVYEKKNHPNPLYVSAALVRADAIYCSLPVSPDILRLDMYSVEKDVQKVIQKICKFSGLPMPKEVIRPNPLDHEADEDAEYPLQVYWDLTDISFQPRLLLREIILGDIGGHSEFVSSVFFADTQNCVLYHLYDDRGADVVAADKGILRPLYLEFTDWILDYDRERIDKTFAVN